MVDWGGGSLGVGNKLRAGIRLAAKETITGGGCPLAFGKSLSAVGEGVEDLEGDGAHLELRTRVAKMGRFRW